MIQLASSCTYEAKDTIKIDWKTVDLPKDSLGHTHLGLAGPLVGKIGHTVFIGGGANFPDKKPWEGGRKQYHNELFVYNWKHKTLVYDSTYRIPFSLAYAACYSDENVMYVVGGENENDLHVGAYAFGLEVDRNLRIDTLPSLPEGISNAALVCIDQVLYLIGGETKQSTSDQILSLDIRNGNTWKRTKQLPYKISNAVVEVIDRKIYIMGGRSRTDGEISPFSDRVYCFDTEYNMITELKNLQEPLAAAVGIGHKDQIFFLGGDNAQTYHQVEALLLQASAETDMERKDSIIRRKNELQVNHPGFSRKQMVYDIASDTWQTLQADFPFDMPVTTTAIRMDNNFMVIPSGEIKAGVRTDKIYIGEIITQN